MASSSTAAQALMRKGKRGAAAYIHNAVIQYSSTLEHLDGLLDTLLNPDNAIDDWDMIDWFKWLIAGGRTPDEFANIVMRYDNATMCGLVWTANFVAYRCRTCGISPCMSLCAECFQKGNHDGHDFNMFRSQAGGACDCGDTNVMKEIGFCERHGPKAQVNKPSVPNDLMRVAEIVMPRIILRLLQHLRESSTKSETTDSYLSAIQEADLYLTMLHDFSAMGAAMRRVMTNALTNPQHYRNLTSCLDKVSKFYKYMLESKKIYEEAVRSLPNPEPPDEFKECVSLQESLVHRTFLEELVFWTVKFEFPQKMVCLLLNMLPDPEYKEALTQAFVLHYSRISMMLERSNDPDMLSNRVVHVSVQIFSNESLALRMAEQFHLLHVMVISLKYMMSKILVQNTLHDADRNFHYVVDCSRRVMKEHCYWPLVSDLNNVLSHRPIAMKFMSDDTLLEMWFAFLAMFQGMNVNQRELNQHVEFEPNTYYAAFSAELEASAYPMWALVSHLTDSSTVDLTKRVLTNCLMALQEWLDAINYTDIHTVDNLQVSFHLPLHRYLAVFMCQAIKHQGLSLQEVLLPYKDILMLIMMHPLRVQVAFYEILSGMWVRNGLQIKGQAMTYIQCNFCNSMVDADLYLLQVCATQVPTETFLATVMEKFHVVEWMSLAPYTPVNTFLEGEYDTPMLESFLTFLTTIISVRTNLGVNDAALSQLEMVTLLCMGDKVHSQLIELMPERCGTAQNRDSECVLADVADYKAPNLEASGNMQQGMYVPKPKVWEELYDPIHVLLRAVHRRDFQTSMDRFTEYVQQAGKFKGSGTPWPPYRTPAPCNPAYEDPRKLLCSRVFHALVFVVLHKAVHARSVSEHVMSLIIYLLEMAVDFAEPVNQNSQLCQTTPVEPKEIKDKDLTSWYNSDWLSANLRTVIKEIKIEIEPAVVFDSSDSDIDWEGSEMEEGELHDSNVLMLEVVSNMDIEESALAVNTLHNSDSSELLLPPPDIPVDVSNLENVAPVQFEESLALQVPNQEMDTAAVQLADGELLAVEVLTNMATSQTIEPPQATVGVSNGVVPANGEGYEIVLASSIPGPSTNNSPTITHEMPLAIQTVTSDSTQYTQQVAVPGSNRILRPLQSTGIKLKKRRQVMCISEANPEAMQINESIISLLLKLHSHLSGTPDSYVPSWEIGTSDNNGSSSSSSSHADMDSRIGDGPFFVAKVLNKIAMLDNLCKESICETRNLLWPKKEEKEEEVKEREAKEKEEKKRKAKERQQKLIEEFASKQKEFLAKVGETVDDGVAGMDWSDDTQTVLTSRMEYDCVICNQTTPSTEDKLMGLVVLVQATSVLGHRRRKSDDIEVPTNDEERPNLRRDDTQACEFDRRMDELSRHFDEASLLVSVNQGWEGGVHVQTCGHHLHLACLTSYLQSLRSQRQASLAVERGEYSCPLCRQLANSVLPLSPQLGECTAVVRSRPGSSSSIVEELFNFLKENPPRSVPSYLKDAMTKAMTDMIQHNLKQRTTNPSNQCFFLFVSSIARTNIEIEIIQRGGSLCVDKSRSRVAVAGSMPLMPKRSCIVPLLHVLAMHSQILAEWPVWRTWRDVAGSCATGEQLLALAPVEREVPVLLRDPTALLTQFILLLPLHLDQTYFSCVVKVLFNLLYIQVLAQITCHMSESERTYWKSHTPSVNSMESTLSFLITHLEKSQLYIEDEINSSTSDFKSERLELDWQVQQLCLPFLRVASLLRHHLYIQPLPEIVSSDSEFVSLVYFLELVTEGMDLKKFNSSVALNWASDGMELAGTWCDEFVAFVNRSQIAARNFLVDQHLTWHQPRLLRLPYHFDKVFQYYHRRQCSQCHSVPKEVSICLICGTVVCLKEPCCKQGNICEAVQHSIDCGGGTGMYLVVTTSYTIVIRGKRACLWGSLYLDIFGEEDKDLKRGKPLFLSSHRYKLLEQQWLAHRFDHINRRWVWHRDSL